MDLKKKKALEAAGWKFGDAADFLGMDEKERQILDARVQLALAVRRLREKAGLTQTQLAGRMKTSQPRIVKIEHAAADVSLDQMIQAIVAVGGRFRVKQLTQPAKVKIRRRGGARKAAEEDQPTTEVVIELVQ
jgi:transcriptional regulator with XRE-family HTH domain